MFVLTPAKLLITRHIRNLSSVSNCFVSQICNSLKGEWNFSMKELFGSLVYSDLMSHYHLLRSVSWFTWNVFLTYPSIRKYHVVYLGRWTFDFISLSCLTYLPVVSFFFSVLLFVLPRLLIGHPCHYGLVV